MEFGWYHEFHCQVEQQSDADAFAQALEQVAEAERWGLDAVWLAEIHQQASRSVLSAPLTVAAAIAARTTRLKIGTGVQVLPLCHPLRLAEETATIDQISRGRLLLGAGRSGNPRAYAAYGVPYAESRERFYETLDILKQAWTQPSFSYAGKYWQFNEARAVPRPYQQPHPPIRIAGASEDTFPVLGALGYPLFVAVRSGSLSGLAPDLQAYRDAYQAVGHPGKGEVYLRLSLHLAETDARALEEAEPSVMQLPDTDHAAGRFSERPQAGRVGDGARYHLPGGAARQGRGGQSRACRRPAVTVARGVGNRRHPGRTEFRRQHTSRADDALAATLVRRGEATARLRTACTPM